MVALAASASMNFYGHSFVAGPDGAIVAEADREQESFVTHTFDFEAMRLERASWGGGVTSLL
jgi:N-carbamoylputrescine amidase